jgi:hypothetical protein
MQEKFATPIIVFSITILMAMACSSGTSIGVVAGNEHTFAGPLKVSQSNPRYFTDDSGRVVFLSGFEFWDVLLLDGEPAPESMSWSVFLDISQQHGTNFIRLWIWNELTRFRHKPDVPWYSSKEIWKRTGPGTALDGKPKFDLTKFNQQYFDELRSRVIQAGEKGFYVSIMFFEGWSLRYMEAPWNWDGHPFNVNNNINGIDGDPDKDGLGTESHTLQIPAIVKIQENYVRKVIDTLNDLDNVLYEISNEDHRGSADWQYHMINYIKNYERDHKPRQHPVWMSVQYTRGDTGAPFNDVLFNSPADCIAPNSVGGYKDNPPAGDGRKIIISDTDHLCGCILDRAWVWKSFTRGLNIVNYMELPELVHDGSMHVSARRAMGHVLHYANKTNLSSMVPRNDLASTTYCLADPDREYLVYQPASGASFNVNLSAGDYSFEWFNPGIGAITKTGSFSANGGKQSFTPPFGGDAVLYIYKP